MFVVIARYKIEQSVQKQFVAESKHFFLPKMRLADGFVRISFLRNVLDHEYVDVITEWRDRNAFWQFIQKHPEQPKLRMSLQVLERYLYETL